MRKWLAEIRKERRMSQQETADAAGISQSYYASIEIGIRGKPLGVPVAKCNQSRNMYFCPQCVIGETR
mgnify:CR=1 FL=1